MAATDHLRNNIIDKLLSITNKDYLTALYKLVEKSAEDSGKVKLTKAQIQILHLSDADIKSGKLISQEDVDKSDLKWLKEL
jgi:hypothetical protein